MANQLLIGTPQGAQWSSANGQLSIGPFTINTGLGLVEPFTANPMLNGDNTFTVPAGSQGCLVIPPAGNATALTARTVGGDTGTRIHKTFPNVVTLDTAALPASVIINSAGGGGVLTVIFW